MYSKRIHSVSLALLGLYKNEAIEELFSMSEVFLGDHREDKCVAKHIKAGHTLVKAKMSNQGNKAKRL